MPDRSWKRPKPTDKLSARGRLAPRIPVAGVLVTGVLVTVLLSGGCSKRSRRLPTPSKREYVNRVRGCGADVMHAYEANIIRTLKGDTAGRHGARLLAQLESPEGKSRVRSLARRLMRRLIDRLRAVRSQAKFHTLITSGQLKPLRACYAAKRCRAFARCTVRHHPGRQLQATEVVHVLTSDGLPGKPAASASATARPSQPQPGSQPQTPPGFGRLATVDLSRRDPKLDHRESGRTGRAGRAGRAGRPPALWATYGNSLLLLAPGKDTVIEQARLDLSPSAAGPHGGSPRVHRGPHGTILVRTSKAILLLDRQHKLHHLWSPAKGRRVAAMTTWGHRVLVAAEGSLIVLDNRMQEMGRVHLGLRDKWKEAHHILFHKDQALLLDNIVSPIWLFRVDLSKPSQPRILQRIREYGVGAHLIHQWVDTSAKRWATVVRSGGRSGTRQSVLLMNAEKPPAKPSAQPSAQTKPRTSNLRHRFLPGYRSDPAVLARPLLFNLRRGRYTPQTKNKPSHRDPDKVQGHKLLCGIPAPPHWAIFTREDQQKIYLGQLRVKGSSVVVGHKVALTGRDCHSWTRRRGQAPKCRRSRLPRRAAMDQRGRWLAVTLGGWLVWLKAGPGGGLRVVKQLQSRSGTLNAVSMVP